MLEKDEHYYDDDLLNDCSLIAVVGLLKGPFHVQVALFWPTFRFIGQVFTFAMISIESANFTVFNYFHKTLLINNFPLSSPLSLLPLFLLSKSLVFQRCVVLRCFWSDLNL